jgi:arginyl-tRNA synthetase
MPQKLLFAKHIAIKHLVIGHLMDALSVYTSTCGIPSMESEKVLLLYKSRRGQPILYISAVALEISKLHNCRPMEIAEAIATHLSRVCEGVFITEKISPGLIYIQLTSSTIAAWLQNMIGADNLAVRATAKELITKNSSKNSSTLFSTQYAHARCCALLRLAQQEGLMEFTSTNHPLLPIPVQPIPWLHRDGKLLLAGLPEEMDLINQLVKVTDNCVCDRYDQLLNWEKIAGELSQAWENFWQHCRIWGDVKVKSPELAQSRIGLLLVTQLVLQTVLTEKMRVLAPSEL